MAEPIEMLKNIKIASPCHASWDDMHGDDKARFCGLCQRHVYDLSAVGKEEAETLVLEHEGRMCVRFYKRRDGTMLTADCPRGLLAVRKRLARGILVSAAMMLSLFAVLQRPGEAGSREDEDRSIRLARLESRAREIKPIGAILDLILPSREMGDISRPIMGKIATPVNLSTKSPPTVPPRKKH